MHGTFASESQEEGGNYHAEVVQKAPREPKKKTNRYALLAIPVVVILCGVLYYSTKSAPIIESGMSESSKSLLFSSVYRENVVNHVFR